MSSTVLRAPALEVLSVLDRAVDDLLTVDFSALSTREQIEVTRRIEQVSRRLPAAAQRIIANPQRWWGGDDRERPGE